MKLKPTLTAIVTNGFLEDPYSSEAIKNALEQQWACFLMVDKNANLPEGWCMGLNLRAVSYYESPEELSTIAYKMGIHMAEYLLEGSNEN